MRRVATIAMLLPYLDLSAPSAFPQDVIEDLGLEGVSITSISASDGILAVGTHRHGVYWQPE